MGVGWRENTKPACFLGKVGVVVLGAMGTQPEAQ